MDAERPTAGREVGEQRVQLGPLGHQGGEFVDDHDESREGTGGEVVDRARSGIREHALAPQHLRTERLDRPPGQALVEIAERAEDVRQPDQRGERRAALEVDQHERHLVGRATRGHAEHPRDEQLALACARRARDDRVRTVGHEIEDDETVGGDAERGAETGAGDGREELAETDRVGQPGGGSADAGGPGRVRESCGGPPCGDPRRRVGASGRDPFGHRLGSLTPGDHELVLSPGEAVAPGKALPRVVRQLRGPRFARRELAHGRGRGAPRSGAQREGARDGRCGDRGSVDRDPGPGPAQQRSPRDGRRLVAEDGEIGRLVAPSRPADVDAARGRPAADREHEGGVGRRPVGVERREPLEAGELRGLSGLDPLAGLEDARDGAPRRVARGTSALPTTVDEGRDGDHRSECRHEQHERRAGDGEQDARHDHRRRRRHDRESAARHLGHDGRTRDADGRRFDHPVRMPTGDQLPSGCAPD